jgi:tetratricopeptide (TPR) repeat protein
VHRDARIRSLLASAERHTAAGRFTRAVHAYRRVLRVTAPGDFAHELAHARLGDLHLGQDRPALALPHLRRALELSDGEPEYALMIGRALNALRRGDEAALSLFDALPSPFHAADALAELAHAAALRGDRSAAGALARRAAERDPRWRATARQYADA